MIVICLCVIAGMAVKGGSEPVHQLYLVPVQKNFAIVLQLLKQARDNDPGSGQFISNKVVRYFDDTGAGQPLFFFEIGNQAFVQFMKSNAFL